MTHENTNIDRLVNRARKSLEHVKFSLESYVSEANGIASQRVVDSAARKVILSFKSFERSAHDLNIKATSELSGTTKDVVEETEDFNEKCKEWNQSVTEKDPFEEEMVRSVLIIRGVYAKQRIDLQMQLYAFAANLKLPNSVKVYKKNISRASIFGVVGGVALVFGALGLGGKLALWFGLIGLVIGGFDWFVIGPTIRLRERRAVASANDVVIALTGVAEKLAVLDLIGVLLHSVQRLFEYKKKLYDKAFHSADRILLGHKPEYDLKPLLIELKPVVLKLEKEGQRIGAFG